MQIHQLRPIHKAKKSQRLGRGGRRGNYSGRGIKGQKARAGRKLQPAIRQVIKRYPKLRGCRFKSRRAASAVAILNLDALEKKFQSGEEINPVLLLERKIIRKIKGESPKVVILGRGDIAKPLTFSQCFFSKSAKEKIKKAGGTIKT